MYKKSKAKFETFVINYFFVHEQFFGAQMFEDLESKAIEQLRQITQGTYKTPESRRVVPQSGAYYGGVQMERKKTVTNNKKTKKPKRRMRKKKGTRYAEVNFYWQLSRFLLQHIVVISKEQKCHTVSPNILFLLIRL